MSNEIEKEEFGLCENITNELKKSTKVLDNIFIFTASVKKMYCPRLKFMWHFGVQFYNNIYIYTFNVKIILRLL